MSSGPRGYSAVKLTVTISEDMSDELKGMRSHGLIVADIVRRGIRRELARCRQMIDADESDTAPEPRRARLSRRGDWR